MDNDRELLELAAKAYWAGEIDDVCSVEWSEEDQSIAYTHGSNQDHNGCDVTLLWNPLADDGDALRLAVKLRMALDIGEDGMVKTYAQHAIQGHGEDIGDDPYADTRRAIVRSAAEIGRQGKD